jgi:hypothetical protein
MLLTAYILPAAVLLWVQDKKIVFRAGFPIALGALGVGALPFLLFQIFSGWPVLKASQGLASFSLYRLRDLLTKALPILIGFVPPVQGVGHRILLVFAAGLYAAAMGCFLYRQRQGLWSLLTFRRMRIKGGELLVLLVLTNVSLSLFTGFNRWLGDHCQRYLLPLYTAIPLFLFTLLDDWARKYGTWIVISATIVLMGFHLQGNLAQHTWLIVKPESYRKFQELLSRERELIRWLRMNGYNHIYTDDTIGRKLTLLDGRGLVYSDPYQEVYPQAFDQVAASPKVGFLFHGENSLFENTLAGAGGGYRRIKINEHYTLYGDFVPPPASQIVSRTEWTVKAKPDSGNASEVMDGDIDSAWSSPQIPGTGLLIDMGRITPVSRIFFIPSNYREVPAGLQVEVSADGKQWHQVSRTENY